MFSLHVCSMCRQCWWRSGEDVGALGMGTAEDCSLLCGCWESNLKSLEEPSESYLINYHPSPSFSLFKKL